ncbi:hypothetical protein ACHAW5_009385 [Stephanodiscus triporus]|uniref:protein-L-isoaspartate(D-aspartate) O-methyltransferase n=1 Tax=Stephanodiscus triporus TaxID=2934178 RepID=A0ABD3PLM7_9STRA
MIASSSRRLFLLVHFLASPKKVFASPAPSLFDPTLCSASEQSLAYVNKGNNPEGQKPPMRAWMCSGKTHKEMVDKLTSAGIVKAPINREAMLSVDRRNYVIDKSHAYDDSPQTIGYGATISAPHMHAHVLEDLLPSLLRASRDHPTKPLRILDVGCGSGYLTAVFGRMVHPKKDNNRKSLLPSLSPSASLLNDGKVFGIDVIPQLVQMSARNIMKEDGDLLDSNIVEVAVRDGWKGFPEGAPYNAIHVGAAAATFPIELMKQLAVGGIMVVPVGPDGGEQYLYQVERVGDQGQVVGEVGSDDSKGFQEDDYNVRRVLGVRYVPLVRAD